jgi:hypothetical protein
MVSFGPTAELSNVYIMQQARRGCGYYIDIVRTAGISHAITRASARVMALILIPLFGSVIILEDVATSAEVQEAVLPTNVDTLRSDEQYPRGLLSVYSVDDLDRSTL